MLNVVVMHCNAFHVFKVMLVNLQCKFKEKYVATRKSGWGQDQTPSTSLPAFSNYSCANLDEGGVRTPQKFKIY